MPRAALEARLHTLAHAGDTVTYGELARSLGLRIAELTALLEQLMEADHADSRPFRAAVLRARLGDGLPAAGFFLKAAELGVTIIEPAEFIAAERLKLRSVP